MDEQTKMANTKNRGYPEVTGCLTSVGQFQTEAFMSSLL